MKTSKKDLKKNKIKMLKDNLKELNKEIDFVKKQIERDEELNLITLVAKAEKRLQMLKKRKNNLINQLTKT